MAYKLIAIDIDDTLLTDNREIPLRVHKAIQKARAKGFIVVLCTGRTKKGAQRFYDELEMDTLFITAGGAEVYDKNGHTVFSTPVDSLLVKEILTYAYSKGLHPQVFIDGELVFKEHNRYAAIYEKPYGYPGIVMPDIMEQEKIITPKVLFVLEEDQLPEIKKEVEQLFPTLTIERSKPMFLEFAQTGVNKGIALQFVANYYGVDMSEVIAIGDNGIDVPMIQEAGLGVAVANATDEVLKVADVICPSNNDGGVAEVIEKYILEASS